MHTENRGVKPELEQNQKGRSSGSILLHCKSLFIPISLLATVVPAFLYTGCEEPLKDMTLEKASEIRGYIEMEYPENHTDSIQLLIYSDNGTKPLIAERRIPAKTTTVQWEEILNEGKMTKGSSEESGYIVVGLAVNEELNMEALQNYDSAEHIRYDFLSDNPQCPVAGGELTIWKNETQETDCLGKLTLTPLFCRIILASVTNTMSGYLRLENPRVHLSNVNSSAEILRADGFRPTELIDATESIYLPCDVGLYPQYPRTELYAYPNDFPEESPGTPRTCLILECEIKGIPYSFSASLPPLKRNGTVEVDLTINGPGDFTYGTRQ